MPLTEEEARTKWCPMARMLWADHIGGAWCVAAVNRDHLGHIPHGSSCLASGCALWTWVDGYEEKGRCGLGRV